MSDLYAAPTTDELQSTGAVGGNLYAAPSEEELKASEPKSLEGFGKNLVQDVKGTAEGVWNLGKGLAKRPGQTLASMGENLPEGLINEGKRIGLGELLTGHPINAVEKLGEAAYEKPLTTAFDVVPVAEGAGKLLGIGGEAAGAAGAAETAAQGAKAIPLEEAGQAATKITPEILPETAEEGGKVLPGILEKAKSELADPAKELQTYLTGKYGTVAGKPGFANTLSDYLQRYAQDMSLKNIGGSVRQIRQMGPESGRALGQYGLDTELTSPGLGDIGLGKQIEKRLADVGEKVGQFRKAADTLRDATQNPIDVLQEVRARLDPKYLSGRGLASEEASAYKKALEEVEDAQASHEGLSKLSTKLNQYASENKLKQATGAVSDVANTVSEVNNNRIRALLGPEKAAQYDKALADYGALKKIDAMHDFKEAREAAGRLGPGGGVRHMAQKFLDDYGYRAGAQIANRLSKIIRSSPQVARTLPSIFHEFVDQVHDLLPEDFTSTQMAEGGIVGMDELHDFLSSKYNTKEKR